MSQNQRLIDYIVQAIVNRFNVKPVVRSYPRSTQISFYTTVDVIMMVYELNGQTKLVIDLTNQDQSETFTEYIEYYDDVDDIMDAIANKIL